MNENTNWQKNFPGAITVTDKNGVIIFMNEKASQVFKDDGGYKLIGTNVFDCHPEPSRSKLKDLYENPKTNIYTIEKNGIKKLICQTPLFDESEFNGFVELSLEIPFEMPHFIRG
jgi:transcriptional regulator with PAS, ATPase and Fis domain